MAKARGKVEEVDLLQVSGLDSRIWQKEGSSSDNGGVVFSLRGEVAKVRGIQPLVDWALEDERLGEGKGPSSSLVSSVYPFYDPTTGTLLPLMSIGAFNMNGAVEILIEYGGRLAVVRGNTLEVLAEGRRVARRPSDGTQFIQVGDAVIILNGYDPNIKWDGYKVTPLGIQSPPSPPVCPGWSDGFEPSQVVNGNVDDQYVYPGSMIQKVDGDLVNDYIYKLTWVNDQGTESEDSSPSEKISDKNVIASSTDRGFGVVVGNLGQPAGRADIVGRRLYRAGADGESFYLLADLPGTKSNTYLDVTEVTYTSTISLPAPNTRLPPPVSKFAIYFRGKTFYAGNPVSPRTLYHSLGSGQKESVPQPSNMIQVTTEDGSDYITAMCVVSDYALVFTKRSIHMLTMSKDGGVVLTPMSQTIGCVGNRAVTVFENRVYFFSRQGLFLFDGSVPKPLSSELNQQVTSLPPAFLKDIVSFVSPEERRVCFSVCAGPGGENNEVWAVHIDTGAVSKVGASVFAALRYKDQTLVSFSYDKFGPLQHIPNPTEPDQFSITNQLFRMTELGVWGCLNSIAEVEAISGFFDTRWLIGKNPDADKTFHRMDLFYVQTGNYPLEISWFVDWKNEPVGNTSVTMMDPEGLAWGETVEDPTTGAVLPRTWDDGYSSSFTPKETKGWDERRVRSVRLDMSKLAGSPEGALTAKAIKFRFGVDADDSKNPNLDECWRIVGFVLFYSDHGVRAEGTDTEGV